MKLFITTMLMLAVSISCTKKDSSKETKAFHAYGFKLYVPVKGSAVTAGFGEIKNMTDKPMKVAAVSSKFFRAVELHNMIMENDMMKMEKMTSVEIKPKSSLLMKSGSYHMMFFDPKQELKVGHEVPVNMKINGEIKVIGFKIVERD